MHRGLLKCCAVVHESALAAGLSADLIHSDLSEFDKRMAADEGIIA